VVDARAAGVRGRGCGCDRLSEGETAWCGVRGQRAPGCREWRSRNRGGTGARGGGVTVATIIVCHSRDSAYKVPLGRDLGIRYFAMEVSMHVMCADHVTEFLSGGISGSRDLGISENLSGGITRSRGTLTH
jgi:hypothetical protein